MKALTQRNAIKAVTRVAQFVQDTKIEQAKLVLYKQIAQDRFPPDFRSYNGTVADRNAYDDPEKFFRVMATKPQWYRRKFTFLPIDSSALRDLRPATALAFRITRNQVSRYGRRTGTYARSFGLFLLEDGKRRRLTDVTDLDRVGEFAKVQLLSVDPAASTIEKNALYFARIGGVLYHAAQQVAAAYPGLAVRFTYYRPDSLGLSGRYNIPVLTIGSRAGLRDKLVKPGKNHRRRQRRGRARRANR